MYVMIIIACMTHLFITASEQELQTPKSPRETDTPRPETPSNEHTVTIHRRQPSLTALSIASATQSRSSISSAPSSPQSANSTTPLTIRTDSPKHATPIRVTPKSDPNRNLFPSGYLPEGGGRIPVVDVDDEDGLTWRCYCLCATCVTGVLVGVVLAIWAGATGGHLS